MSPGKVVSIALLAGLFIAGVLHLNAILENTVNVLYYDEWEILKNSDILVRLDYHWLFELHNEHRIVLTKFVLFIVNKITSLNYSYLLFVNFLLFSTILISLLWIYKNLEFSSRWLPLFILSLFPLLNTKLHENHFWAFQSCFHFSVLFIIWNSYLLTKARSLTSTFAIVFLIAAAVYSLASSIASMAALVLCFLFIRAIAKDDLERKWSIRRLLLLTACTSLIIGSYFLGYKSNPGHPEPTLPWNVEFWVYLTTMVGEGIGLGDYDLQVQYIASSIILILLLVPVLLFLLKRSWDHRVNFVVLASTGVLASIAVITLGRAGFGPDQARSSRYMEYVVLLFPLIVMGISNLKISFKLGYLVQIPIAIIIWISCIDSFDFEETYSELKINRLHGLACIRDYYEGNGNGFCPQVYPVNISDRLDNAKKLNLSFYQEWNESRLDRKGSFSDE